jgi:hypothetical protein
VTAEVAVLNRYAVALAADSAVTAEGADGAVQVFQSVNKMFALSYRDPVGVMLYDSPDFASVPWETLVKLYRRRRSDRPPLPRLEEYADDLLDFLGSPNLITPALRRTHAIREAEALLAAVATAVEAQPGIDAAGPIRRRRALDAALDAQEALWGARSVAAGAVGLTAEEAAVELAGTEDSLIDAILSPYGVVKRQRARAKALVRSALTRVSDSAAASGLVVTGFGEDELFPSYRQYWINGTVGGRVNWDLVQERQVSADIDAVIVPFAQRETVDTFLTGISPVLRDAITDRLDGRDDTLLYAVERLFRGDVPPGALADKMRALRGISEAQDRLFRDHMWEDWWRQEVQTIIRSVAMLPKNELAEMAESLVNITSFRQRVSMGTVESVGGATDVAVISHGDGFVWIRRKHYFTAELNPGWHAAGR